MAAACVCGVCHRGAARPPAPRGCVLHRHSSLPLLAVSREPAASLHIVCQVVFLENEILYGMEFPIGPEVMDKVRPPRLLGWLLTCRARAVPPCVTCRAALPSPIPSSALPCPVSAALCPCVRPSPARESSGASRCPARTSRQPRSRAPHAPRPPPAGLHGADWQGENRARGNGRDDCLLLTRRAEVARRGGGARALGGRGPALQRLSSLVALRAVVSVGRWLPGPLAAPLEPATAWHGMAGDRTACTQGARLPRAGTRAPAASPADGLAVRRADALRGATYAPPRRLPLRRSWRRRA